METIFDFNPTVSELEAIGIDSISMTLRHGINLSDTVSKDSYLNAVSQDDTYFDLALLFEFRNHQKQADEYWAKINERHQQYLLGFDDLVIVK